jgi:hypothetical protein
MPMSAHDRERADASMVLTRCGTCGAHTLGTLLDGREWHRLHPCGQVPVEPAPPPPEVERHERHERQAVRRHVTVEGATVFA